MSARRIIIVGGGIAGMAVAYHLARRGMGERILLLERETTLGQHATGQNAAIMRTAISSWATRQLARRTEKALHDPQGRWANGPYLHARGLIVSEGAAQTPEPDWVADHREWGTVERVGNARVAQLAAVFCPAGARSWWFPQQGVMDVALLLGSLAAGAREGGVRVRLNENVAHLHVGADRVAGVVLKTGEVLEADLTIIAAGGWAPILGADAGLAAPFTVTRRHLLVSAPDPDLDPALPVVWDDHRDFYARPESGGLRMSACDVAEVAPQRLVLDEAIQLAIAEKAAVMLPTLTGLRAAHYWAGLRTLTPDDAPVIGPDPRRPGSFWMAGLGGHGISVSLGAGRTAADLILGAPVDPKLAEALSPERFA
ncbi:MAG: FAD-binding oxidoreductase [bacterium]|nr:FAD-binding oxidoreductase [bacterium]